MSVTDPAFWLALLEIIGVNIILSGDNAMVIALACRRLPAQQQRLGVFLGAGVAVLLRLVMSVFVVYLLTVPYLKIVGGLLLFWVAYKLVVPEAEGEDEVSASETLWAAVRTIAIADVVMSLDNVIAVAAAAKGNLVLLVLGLVISIPMVVYGATLMIKIIERFPIIVLLGGALIGWLGGEVIVTDPLWSTWVETQAHWMHYAVPAACALLVVAVAKILPRMRAGAHVAEG